MADLAIGWFTETIGNSYFFITLIILDSETFHDTLLCTISTDAIAKTHTDEKCITKLYDINQDERYLNHSGT